MKKPIIQALIQAQSNFVSSLEDFVHKILYLWIMIESRKPRSKLIRKLTYYFWYLWVLIWFFTTQLAYFHVIIFSQPSFSCSNELFGHFPVVNQWSENWIEFFFQTPEDSPMETCLAILLAGMSQVEELLEENRAKKSITAFMSANSRAIPAAVHLLRLFRPSNKIQWRGRSLVNPAMEGFIYRYILLLGETTDILSFFHILGRPY